MRGIFSAAPGPRVRMARFCPPAPSRVPCGSLICVCVYMCVHMHQDGQHTYIYNDPFYRVSILEIIRGIFYGLLPQNQSSCPLKQSRSGLHLLYSVDCVFSVWPPDSHGQRGAREGQATPASLFTRVTTQIDSPCPRLTPLEGYWDKSGNVLAHLSHDDGGEGDATLTGISLFVRWGSVTCLCVCLCVCM